MGQKFKIGTFAMYNTDEVVGTLTSEIEKINENIKEQLNDKLNKMTMELLNEKNNNNVLMASLTAALNKYQAFESEQKTQEDISFKNKLEKATNDLEKSVTEIKKLSKRYKIY